LRHYVAIAYVVWMGLLVLLYATGRLPLRAPRYFLEAMRATKRSG
jgi:hypothetical protein